MPATVTTLDDTLQVYREPDLTSAVIVQLQKGTQIDLGAAAIHEGREWITATLNGETAGYVLGPSARGHTTLGATSGGRCPNCNMVNPAGTQRCECGYDFAERRVARSLASTVHTKDDEQPHGTTRTWRETLGKVGATVGVLIGLIWYSVEGTPRAGPGSPLSKDFWRDLYPGALIGGGCGAVFGLLGWLLDHYSRKSIARKTPS